MKLRETTLESFREWTVRGCDPRDEAHMVAFLMVSLGKAIQKAVEWNNTGIKPAGIGADIMAAWWVASDGSIGKKGSDDET